MKCMLLFLICVATYPASLHATRATTRQARLKTKVAARRIYNKNHSRLSHTIKMHIDNDAEPSEQYIAATQDDEDVVNEQELPAESEADERDQQITEQAIDVAEAGPGQEDSNELTMHHGLHRRPAHHKTTYFLGNLAWDVMMIFRNLFLWDSFKVIMTTFPFYIASRMVDEKLQDCFFDYEHKKNKHCPPKWVRDTAQASIAVPIILLGSQAFLSHDDDMRIASQVFLLGMPFVLFAKNLIKKLDFDLCKRPWHERFAVHQRSHGGFPSGHMAEAAYMAILYGKRFGPKLAVPLGGIAVFVGAIFLSCNRHYLSQLVAGAGFGALFALAADKVIDSKLAHKYDLGFTVSFNDARSPHLGFAMKF